MELIAGEAENDEGVWVSRCDAFVEGFQSSELRGEAAIGGGVYYQDHFSLVLRHRVGFTFA